MKEVKIRKDCRKKKVGQKKISLGDIPWEMSLKLNTHHKYSVFIEKRIEKLNGDAKINLFNHEHCLKDKNKV